MVETRLHLGAQNLREGMLVGVTQVIRRRMAMEATQAHGEGRVLLHRMVPHPMGSQRRQAVGNKEAGP